MKYNEITSAIYRMAYKRLAKCGLDNAIKHLIKSRNNTWKHNPDIQLFIDSVISELELLQQIPEERAEFVRKYANKYLVEHSNGKPYNISNEYFDKVFTSCALPLNPKFYSLLRLEIFRLLEEVK